MCIRDSSSSSRAQPLAITEGPAAGVQQRQVRPPPPYPPTGRRSASEERMHVEVQAWHNLRQEIYPDQVASRLKGTRLSMAKNLVQSENVKIEATRTLLGFKAVVHNRSTSTRADKQAEHEVNLQSGRLLDATCSCQDLSLIHI